MAEGIAEDIPPPMTPEQMIRLLDKLHDAGCGHRQHKRNGQIVYRLSVDDIWEGDAILSGMFRGNHPAEGEPAS